MNNNVKNSFIAFIVFYIAFGLAIIGCVGLISIWALNTLFHNLNIEYTFENWVAITSLITILKYSDVRVSK